MQTNGYARRVRFGRFELNSEAGELRRDGRPVRIQPQPLRVLALLVQRAGEVVSREELRQQIWDAATFVEFDQGLNYCIRQIRLALNDDAGNPAFIETLKKRGYRFTAAVEAVDTPVVAGPVDPLNAVAHEPPPATQPRSSLAGIYGGVALVLALIVGGLILTRSAVPARGSVAYHQLTSFSDTAFDAALSPDGRMLAFIVGSDVSFPPAGEIYTMMLPDGEPIQRTHDSVLKYGVAFSPDGSQITYTAVLPGRGWTIAELPVLGGESRVFLSNAAGLSWLDAHHLLFSEIKTGLHMGLVTATDRRENQRDIYLPQHERGMAHYSTASPDRKWVLIVEMGPTGAWQRCRLAPFDGRSAGSAIGPDGACRSAAWSPDGQWMYFTATVEGASHLWRQRFPSGAVEQITSGPAQESGVVVSPDGRSIITSLGIAESGVWMHTARGDRVLSAEGYASQLSYSPDGRRLFYLERRAINDTARELWVSDLDSGKSEPVIQGFSIISYDVSPDGRRIVFAAVPSSGPTEIWIASRERDAAPQRLTAAGEDFPFFGPGDALLYRKSQEHQNYLFIMNPDGSGARQLRSDPMLQFKGMSPDRRWALVVVTVNEVPTTAVVAVPVDGSADVRRICPAECLATWSPDGSWFYVKPFLQPMPGMAVAIRVQTPGSMPRLPSSGVQSVDDAATLPGSQIVDVTHYDPSHDGTSIALGPAIGAFAYARTVSHRNLFRVQLP